MAMNDNMKNLIVEIMRELGSDLIHSVLEGVLIKTQLKPQQHVQEPEPEPVVPVTSGGKLINVSDRFFKLSPNLYYCRNIISTVFCNKADFTEETYKLATNSEYNSFTRGNMKDIRGVSLPYPINRGRIIYPINPKNGLMFGYSQVDVGPGWTKDGYWLNGTNPINEGGKDMRGNKSAKAGLDLLPQVCEDLELCSFDEAYEHDWSGVLDMLVYEPHVNTDSKVSGNDIPSSDSRTWIRDLPATGSEFFTWKELLRGWNQNERPSNEQVRNLVRLTTEILHPVRKRFGRIDLGSGLRDNATNKRVGGREGSLHLSGRAADMVPHAGNFTEVYEWCKTNLKDKVRELVLEDVGTSNAHVHVAVRLSPDEPQNIRIK